MPQSVRAHLMLFGVVAVWGASFVLVKDAINDVSPLLFNLVRMGLAFLFLAVIHRRQWMHLTRRADRRSGGRVFSATGYHQTAGLRLTSPSKSGFITGFTVVLVPLLAAFPAWRPPGTHAPRWNAWLGAGLAFSGIVLLSTPRAAIFSLSAHHWTVLSSINLGDMLTLGCAFAFALHIVTQDRVTSGSAGPLRVQPRIPFQQLALLQIGFCTVFMWVYLAPDGKTVHSLLRESAFCLGRDFIARDSGGFFHPELGATVLISHTACAHLCL